MKTISLNICYILIIVFALISCNKDINTPSDEIPDYRIKRKLIYNSIDDTIPKVRHDYYYDSNMNLTRINYCYTINCDLYYVYQLFSYSDNFKLKKKITYSLVSDSIGWQIKDSTLFKYENGKVISEESFYKDQTYIIKYKYSNSVLVNKTEYRNLILKLYTHYEYNTKNLCIKENIYSDSLKTDLNSYKIHEYNENDQLIKSDSHLPTNRIYQTIYYNYNDKGQLILEESKRIDPDIVKKLEWVYRYEYFY